MTAISPTDVWAVGSGNSSGDGDLIENFNGTSWSIVTAPTVPVAGGSENKAALSGISAVSSTDIFAVGSAGKGAPEQILQFNGTTWSALSNLPSEGGGSIAVDAISATDVWTVGGSAIWNFNGTSWTEVATVSGQLVAISGCSANDIYAVGNTLVEQWNGTSWSAVTSAGSDDLTGVTTLSNGTAVAVGDGGIESNATTAAPAVSVSMPASTVSPPAVSAAATPAAATTVSGSSANNIHAVGTSAATVVVAGTLEDPSSTPGTKTKGLIELN